MVEERGRPRAVRCDNSTALTSPAFSDWRKAQEIELRSTQPGKPDQNAYIEHFSRARRDEGLSACLFDSLDEVREKRYSEIRPHDALVSLPPARYRGRLLAAENPVWNGLQDGGAYAGSGRRSMAVDAPFIVPIP
jgi:putative transposase